MDGNSKPNQSVPLCDLTSGLEHENSNLLTRVNIDSYKIDKPFYMLDEMNDIA